MNCYDCDGLLPYAYQLWNNIPVCVACFRHRLFRHARLNGPGVMKIGLPMGTVKPGNDIQEFLTARLLLR